VGHILRGKKKGFCVLVLMAEKIIEFLEEGLAE